MDDSSIPSSESVFKTAFVSSAFFFCDSSTVASFVSIASITSAISGSHLISPVPFTVIVLSAEALTLAASGAAFGASCTLAAGFVSAAVSAVFTFCAAVAAPHPDTVTIQTAARIIAILFFIIPSFFDSCHPTSTNSLTRSL